MGTGWIIASRFEIGDPEKDLLGRGGMGDVYRGTDTQTGQVVAVKVLKPGIVASNPDIVARFVREGQALRQLNHPNIVTMVAAVEEDGQHYLVMEYVAGGSLRDLLEATRPDRFRENLSGLPITRVLEIALDLADALTRAHRLGIIHRDLKPANVLLAEDGTPRLTDFGLAHVAGSPGLTQAGILVGTVGYLSPEACQGEALDARADIWAFGVMLYEMLTGELPFVGETLPAALAAILTQPVPDLGQLCSDAPDALVDLVYRVLEKDRQQRVPSVRLVGAELEAILKGWEVATPARLAPGESRFATPTPPADAPRHNLPAQPTPFVGREAELTELARLLADPDVRLLTVLGAGGMGKTRLALEAGTAQLGNFERGVYLVSLAPLQSVEAIVPTVAEAVGFSFHERGEPKQQLLDYLRQKSLLLIMDNYEHLLVYPERRPEPVEGPGRGDGVGLATDILQAAPDVKILSTSRARLNVQGEHLFRLAGMDFPDWETPEDALEYSAVKLFLQSARRARPGFELEADDLKYISRICRLVGGMPLGILLAAAWIEMLSPQEIAAEIGQSLDFLETDLRDVPERQRSMRAIFDYSWKSLTEREREVFQGLSVFRGGFTRQAAKEVADASLRGLRSLVDKSLLQRDLAGRYGIHELLRGYAAEKLEQSPAAREAMRDRHTAYYAAALQGWAADLKGPRQQAAVAEMEAEIENARAAWNRAVAQGQVGRLDQALEGLCRFYDWRGRWQEGEAACQVAADRLTAGEGVRVRARALAWQGRFSWKLGGAGPAGELLRQSLALLERPELAKQDTRPERAFVLFEMGLIVHESAAEEARPLYEQSLALYRALGDLWSTAYVLEELGWLGWFRRAYGEARRLFEESLAIRRSLDDRMGIARSLLPLGLTAGSQGQLDEGERLLREGVALCQEIGDRPHLADGLFDLACTSVYYRGKFAEACPLLEESEAIYRDLGWRDRLALSNALRGWGRLHQGQYEQARDRARAALAIAREVGHRGWISYALGVLGGTALAEGAHAEAQDLLEESIAVYQEITLREDTCWALPPLGYAARVLGQPSRAWQHLSRALRAGAETGDFLLLVSPLPAAALLLADRGEKERAVELYALASRYPMVANSRWFEDIAGQHIAAVAATLPLDAVAAAQARGRARDLEVTVAELLIELGG